MFNNFEAIAINPNVTVRKTDWIQVCPNCQCERVISYCQVWNIKKGISEKQCRSCNGFKDTIKNKTINGQSRSRFYQNLFNNPTNKLEVKLKQRLAKLGKRGELANNWRGGIIKQERLIARSRDDYKQWRKSVFSRDNHTCQICLIRGGNLEADHIKEWCNYPELRYEVNNGRTLCKTCHKTTDNYGNKAKRKKNAISL